MNSVSRERVVIFSKSADAGAVKTRMRPLLSPEKCRSLHLALLKDTINKVRDFSSVLYLAGSGYLDFDAGMPVRTQTGDDLGMRMFNAFTSELQHFSKVVIIGIDSPTFPVEEIKKAFSALDSYDIVLGPCEDGGYYLIGLRKLVPEMFREIPWGTADVMKNTLEKISAHSYLLLDCYFDVDRPEDLTKLQQEIEKQKDHLKYIRQWLAGYFGSSAR